MSNLKTHIGEYNKKPAKIKFELKIKYKNEIFVFRKITTTKNLSNVLEKIETELKHKIARKEVVTAYELENV